jgi:hypothetical protein
VVTQAIYIYLLALDVNVNPMYVYHALHEVFNSLSRTKYTPMCIIYNLTWPLPFRISLAQCRVQWVIKLSTSEGVKDF